MDIHVQRLQAILVIAPSKDRRSQSGLRFARDDLCDTKTDCLVTMHQRIFFFGFFFGFFRVVFFVWGLDLYFAPDFDF